MIITSILENNDKWMYLLHMNGIIIMEVFAFAVL